MTSDYLKQLQLTKQLEQKAKEAAKARKAAEARLAETKQALEKARRDGLPADEAERTGEEAEQAFARRDNPAAMALCAKCHQQLAELRKAQVEAVLQAARALLAPVPEGDDRTELEALFEHAAQTAQAGRPEEALALAERARDRADHHAAERFRALVERAGELYALADRTGLAAAGREELERATAMAEEERQDAWGPLTACLESILDAFGKRFLERQDALGAVVADAATAGVDLSPLVRSAEEARAALERGEVEASFALLDEAEGSIEEAVTTAGRERLAALRRSAEEVGERGGDLRAFEEAAGRAEQREGRAMLPLLRQAEGAIQQARESLVLHAVELLRPRLALARRLEADIASPLERLEEARAAVREGRLEEALAGTAAAAEAVEDALRDHVDLARELARARELFLSARAVRLHPREAAQMVADSRQHALAGDLGPARALLAEASERLRLLLQDAGARRALAGLTLLSEALAMGAEVQEAEKELMEALDDLREGEVVETVAALDGLAALLRKVSGEAAQERLRKVAQRLDGSPADLSHLRPRLEEAAALAHKGELLAAALLAGEIEGEAIARQHAAADALAERTARLLAIARQLDGDTAEAERGLAEVDRFIDPAGTLVRLSGLEQLASSLVGRLLAESSARLTRAVGAARKNGVSVGPADKLAREAAKALRGDPEKAYAKLLEAEGELEALVALHTEVYDQIVSLSRIAEEAGLPPEGKAMAKLQETKRLFELGKYDGARVSSRACLQEIEAAAAPVLAARAAQECRELAAVAGKLGIPLPALDEVARAEASAGALRAARRAALDELGARMEERVSTVAEMLRAGDRLGVDVTGPRDILDKAASLLEEGRYLDADQALRFARTEGDRTLAAARAVEAEVERAERALDEAEEVGIGVPEAPAVLALARRLLEEGKHPLAQERARMVQAMTVRAAAQHLSAALDAVEAEHGASALAGEDLDRTGLGRDAVLGAAEERGPRTAFRLLQRYAASLADLAGTRSRALAAIEVAARCPPGSAPAAVLPEARNAIERGGFSEALALLRPAGPEQAARDVQRERRSAALALLRRRAEDEGLEGELGALLAEMAEATPERFWKLHREVLRRAGTIRAEGRREDLAGLIDALRALLLVEAELSPAARRLLDLPLSRLAPADLDAAPALRKEAEAALRRAMRSVREVRQAYIDATRAALAEADGLLSDGCLALAARAVVEARHALGWTAERRREMWKERGALLGRVLRAEARGADGAGARALLAAAAATSPKESAEAMAGARRWAEEEERTLTPRIRVDVVEERGERDGRRRLVVELVNEGGAAVGLRMGADGRGELPAALPPGRRRAELEVRGGVLELSYRPLFSRSEETVTAPL